jgi:MFS family permease
MPAGFHLLIAAQFVSALADNALLIVTIALLMEQGLAAWLAPMLKFGFTVSYVVLAPFVGPLADAWPKARLMAWTNAVKVVGATLLGLGLHPALGFAIVGLGAAAYAPAKYGLVTELVPTSALVAANGWIEVSVVGAALLGTVLGGFLVSPWLIQSQALNHLAQGLSAMTDLATASTYTPAIMMVLLTYGLAALLNLGIPDSGAHYATGCRDLRGLCTEFFRANRTLWRDAEGGLSLSVTTLFWGVGATLQFAVLRWAAEVLHLPLDQAAYLQAAVAVGVVVGAGLAGRLVPLHAAERVLPVGVLLGIIVVAAVDVRWAAIALLCLVGAVGGVLVVPLNALLQHRGCTLLSAGRSIAVQGFNENLSVLVMLAAYGALTAMDTPVVPLLHGFGVLIAVAMAALLWRRCQR